jgi:hypothetical protein
VLASSIALYQHRYEPLCERPKAEATK